MYPITGNIKCSRCSAFLIYIIPVKEVNIYAGNGGETNYDE